uniref:NADH dehydrogenase subunit 11 n=1 Tax=Chattonella marina TaxID=90936 RepID=D2Z1Z2_9STRA|nr:NADH dehydrogenase subunit 11 [Chattonella marina]BAI70556.1 NADH dehydrogenase subunit 11 [Chattonella marina]
MKVYINNKPVEVSTNWTVLEACSFVGIDIPRFCYHQELSVAGNCRMCLVEIEKAPKPVASCAMPVSPNMKIFTDTPLVKKAREGVLEFLLLNHPLDCPICDQGGECDLQEQVMVYGSDRSRFYEKKRSVEDKNCGPLIKTIMTRCIHCTRCVRFASEIGAVVDLGTTNRGQNTEIGTFINKTVETELSGNLIDLCPVGALTSKPYAFKCRPWELRSVNSIDIFDGIGSNIRIDLKDSEIVRILPRISKNWITDKIRFSYDGLKNQRLTNPLIKVKSSWEKSSWEKVFPSISLTQNPKDSCVVVGSSLDSETLVSLKNLSDNFNFKKIVSDRFHSIDSDFSQNFSLNLNQLNQVDCCLLVGTDPKLEANLLNLQLQKSKQRQNAKILSIGSSVNSTLSPIFIGLTIKEFIKILEGKHKGCSLLKKSKSPLIIYGSGLLDRLDSTQFYSTIKKINKKVKVWNQDQINLLNSESNSTGLLNLGISPFYPELLKNLECLYLINTDSKFLQYLNKLPKDLLPKQVVYQGHHFPTKFLNILDILLPGKTFVEQKGTFFNIENRCQKTEKVLDFNFQNRSDWQILQMFNYLLYRTNKYTVLNNEHFNFLFNMFWNSSNKRDKLIQQFNWKLESNEFLKTYDKTHYSKKYYLTKNSLQNKLNYFVPSSKINDPISFNLFDLEVFNGFKFRKTYLKPIISDFYLTHSINENSRIMGQCSTTKRNLFTNFLD